MDEVRDWILTLTAAGAIIVKAIDVNNKYKIKMAKHARKLKALERKLQKKDDRL